MANNQRDLVTQTYEKKIANTLRTEKYELPTLKRNQAFLDHLDINPMTGGVQGIAYKFYKERILKFHEEYIDKFNKLILPLILEKGLNFEVPEEELNASIDYFDRKISKEIEKIQILGRIKNEPFYNKEIIESNWSICLDGVENVPFLLALDSKRMIIIDETFNMDMYLFASLGAIPDIRPITKAGNIDLPPNTFSINLQIMLNNEFKQVSILLLKQKLKDIQDFLKLMTNISLIIDSKSDIDSDFTGLKWIKNSLEYSLFKKKEFLQLANSLKVGGLIIDKSVSPMQVQKIQSLKTSVNLEIGYEINKMGTIQYSVITKKTNESIVFDDFNQVICKLPEAAAGSKFASY